MIERRILCEPYLAEEIVDYKIFCFNGVPKMINIGTKSEVDKKTRVTFLDMNWNPMDFQRSDFDRVEKLPQKPDCFDLMMEFARTLSEKCRFVRIDFFIINNIIYFSEFTLYPTSELIKFSPENADKVVGSWLRLCCSIIPFLVTVFIFFLEEL